MAVFSCTGKVASASEHNPSTSTTGIIGLNTVPTARMDKEGTIRFGASHLDPHNHAFMGMQIAKPLYINLRQSMLVSSLGDKPKRVYPGMDIKLRIADEDRYTPEISFGMDSAIGHKRYSSEYFSLSKRVYDFDLTAGVAWGRMGSAGQIRNPFAKFGGHFNQDRDYNDEDANGPRDWFTGKEVGFFAGLEYFTPIEGFSFKADIGSDRYPAETAATYYKKPAAWSIGFNYAPRDWVDFGASLIGGDKIMGRITFQNMLSEWKGKPYKKNENQPPKRAEATTDKQKIKEQANAKNIFMEKIRIDKNDMGGVLYLNDYEPAARQIGRAARHIAENAGDEILTITLIPVRNHVHGKAITLSRRDLESALHQRRGSPEEIWQNASFKNNDRSIGDGSSPRAYKIIPELSFSFGEEDTSHLHRISVIAEEKKQHKWGFLTGNALRFNLEDRLYQIDKIRAASENPVRSDISHFAQNIVTLDRSFLSWMTTILPDFHLAVTAGYLEEMYAGVGGEILYRPFDSPFAIGAEFWRAQKREADSFLALGVKETGNYTGHLNLFYDIPETDITLFAKAGKFLGSDVGGSAGIETLFGTTKIRGFVTATNERDRDAFGKDTSYYGGLQVSLPIGNIPYIPQGSEARIKFAPMGRDAGQTIDKPLSLYDLTEPMSYRHLGRNWQEVLE